MLTIGGAGELLAQQAGQDQQRAAWPVVRRDVPGLPGGVAGNQDDRADGLAADLSGVVLEEAVVAVGAGEVELPVLIQLANVDHDCPDGLRALHGAVQRRALEGDVVGQVVMPCLPRSPAAGQMLVVLPHGRAWRGRVAPVTSLGVYPGRLPWPYPGPR